MSQPDEILNLTAALRADMARAASLIEEELKILRDEWPEILAPVRANRLSVFQVRVLAAIQRLDQQAAATIPTALSTAFELGGWTAALVGGAEPTFTAIAPAVVKAFAATTLDDVLRATQGVRESTKVLIRELSRDQILRALYTGTTANRAAADLRAVLEHFGIHAVTYADGKRVGLAQYTEMLLRTKTAEAYQAGAFDQGEAAGWEWWEISDGFDCGWTNHEDPQKANGMIVPFEVAKAHPLGHPNCLRAATPRPDIETAEQAAGAEPMNPEARTERQRQAAAMVVGGPPVLKRVGSAATGSRPPASVASVAPPVRSVAEEAHRAAVGSALSEHRGAVGQALAAHAALLDRHAALVSMAQVASAAVAQAPLGVGSSGPEVAMSGGDRVAEAAAVEDSSS